MGEGWQVGGGACRYETNYFYTIVPGSLAFTTLVSNSLDERFARKIFSRFRLFPLFLNCACQEFMDVRLNVYFEYCLENLARANLVLWAKTYFPTSLRICVGILTLKGSWSIAISISPLFPCSVEEPIISGLGCLKYALKYVFDNLFHQKSRTLID